jgi:hypothetical protein
VNVSKGSGAVWKELQFDMKIVSIEGILTLKSRRGLGEAEL